MLTLAWAWLLLLLPLPLIFRKKQQDVEISGHLHLPGIVQNGSQQIEQAPASRKAYWLVWMLLIVAVARPLWMGDPIELPSKGRDLMVAVDLSGSMQIEDMVLEGQTVNRFTMVQSVVSDFIERRKGDKLGLILFADHAYLQAPLTQDRRSVAQFLKEAQIGLVGKQTAIGEAIALGVKRFDLVEESNRVLILLTDGSNNSGSISPEQAAQIAAKRGIKIYSIGVGADVMERRTLFGKEQVNPSMDLDENQLTSLAETTGGQYFRARNAQELEQIYQEIDKLEPISRDQISYRPQSELFYLPLAVALFVSILMTLSQLPMIRRLNMNWGKK
ncbi:VWA domain-containing protein [Shewanella sp. D64]|uniref:vWA domain-containing protein n=1 Tax=unclassified Shewanella TaxID=196818 RepID=UPI0022BA4634|nr:MULTISPECIES: VWA domain-containing protein [unclassified Shewanella]MEC4728903.1 VWA domain-containing protein [Shewanella sp. D64]MEC4740777.1 VWA domain-containing protein [Shewanella sp. E94]WBJ97387.1 VWA domain-containing protein [Shewanella sp. MTB7]